MSNETPGRPMQNLLDAVGGGYATVALSPEEFVHIERDCEEFKLVIQNIQRIMDTVERLDNWQIGDKNDEMVSARTVVGWFRSKAKNSADGNDVYAIMEQHYKIVEDIQEVHRLVRTRMMDADAEFAAEFERLSATLPERPPEGNRFGPYLLPDGSTK